MALRHRHDTDMMKESHIEREASGVWKSKALLLEEAGERERVTFGDRKSWRE